MKSQSIKLIVLDLGKTLLSDNNKISIKNIEAIAFAKNKKSQIALATARMYSSTKYISSVIDADYGIFGNGCQIMNLKTKNTLYQKTIDNEIVKYIIEYARSNNLYLHVSLQYEEVSEEYDYFTKKHLTLNKNYSRDLKSNVKLVDDLLSYTHGKPVLKLIICSTDDLDHHIENITKYSNKIHLNEYCTNIYEEIIDKNYNYADFGGKKVSKGTGLKYLLNELGIDASDVMAIGDLENDTSLLEMVGLPIAMKNAQNVVKEKARYITKNDNNNSGVAEAIYKEIGDNNENSD